MKVHLLLLAILLILNFIPDRFIDRKKYILPLSFLLILIYWAIRYDYGLDYWAYYNSFYSGTEEKTGRGFGEKGYFLLSSLFSKYYQVIIAHSIIVVVTLFHMARKYIPSDCYWLFFLLLFAVPAFHFGMISALRNALAACIMYWAFDICYLTKTRWPLFFLFVLLASMFHTSALFFVIFPLGHILLTNSRGIVIFSILLVLNIASMFFVNQVFNYMISISSLTEAYNVYNEVATEANLNRFIFKSLALIPTFYFCKLYDHTKDNTTKNIFICSFIFLAIEFFGMNWGGRFTLYLYIFFIIALSLTYQTYVSSRRVYMTTYLLSVTYGLVKYYQTLSHELFGVYSDGNYLFYHTIFEANPLP